MSGIVKTAAAAVSVALFLSYGGSAPAQPMFSDASINGAYASLFSGSTGGNNPEALSGVGIFVADGAGDLRGHETYTINGTICNAKISGVYVVGANGSGSDSVKFITKDPGCSSGTYTQSLVVAGGGQLVLLNNTKGGQITEEWHLRR